MSDAKVFPANMVRVCVDAVADGIVSGRAYSKMSESVFSFESLAELLVKVDKFFDACGYPQNFQERRTFAAAEQPRRGSHIPRVRMDDGELFGMHGERCTIDIFVQSRRHSGWQGFLMSSADPDRRVAFRSELELLDEIHRLLHAPEKEQTK